MDDAARQCGIAPGMTVTRARSLSPDLVVVDADPDDDLSGLRRLAHWAGRRYSPIVAPDPPNGLWIDITGCAHRFDGEMPLLKDILRRVSGSGLACQVAVADTAGCAHAIARHVPAGRPTVIDPGKTQAAMAILPIHALRIEPGIAEELRRMGFERIEQLMSMARAPLAKRFGRQLFKRLDQALGNIPEPIEPIFEADVPKARRGMLEPIGTAEAFTHVVGDLVRDLGHLLVARGIGVRRLDLFFERIDSHFQVIRVGTATATRDEAHLAKLLCQRLDTVDPGMGVEAMVLVAPLTEPLGASHRHTLVDGGRRGPDLAALVDALVNRFGQQRLYRAGRADSAMPEREIMMRPPLAQNPDIGWDDDLPRPSRMLTPPEPVEVIAMLPDHPPAQFLWRGKRHRIAQADGPERLHGEWWREAGHEAETPYAVRDYFQVETSEGRRYWLFRLGDGERPSTGSMRWFIHGAFA